MKKQVDLNCDMGEAFGQWSISAVDDKDILPFISSANVATGFHAGDPNHMNRLVKLARENNVKIGAHPGYNDLQGFGRRKISASNQELINDIVYQIGALKEFCLMYGVKLNHIKPHGALYMELAENRELANDFVNFMLQVNPRTPIYCMGSSHVYSAAFLKGHPVVREFYADRDYDNNGSIVFTRHRSKPDVNKVLDKVLMACQESKVITTKGDIIDIDFESVCFHSDTPGSLEIARALKIGLQKHGILVKAIND